MLLPLHAAATPRPRHGGRTALPTWFQLDDAAPIGAAPRDISRRRSLGLGPSGGVCQEPAISGTGDCVISAIPTDRMVQQDLAMGAAGLPAAGSRHRRSQGGHGPPAVAAPTPPPPIDRGHRRRRRGALAACSPPSTTPGSDGGRSSFDDARRQQEHDRAMATTTPPNRAPATARPPPRHASRAEDPRPIGAVRRRQPVLPAVKATPARFAAVPKRRRNPGQGAPGCLPPRSTSPTSWD